MEILEVDSSEYQNIIPAPYHVFGSASFNELNKNKCDEVYYLLFKEGKFRLGIIGGRRGALFTSPFSAPFGGLIYLSKDIRIQYIEEALDCFNDWAIKRKFKSISLILPPYIYDTSFIAKQTNCMFRKGYELNKIDLDYSILLNDFDESYIEHIPYSVRKNLQVAHKAGMKFVKCRTENEKKLSYDIIRINRDAKGYTLRMTWQQVADTSQIIPADFFLVYNDKEIPIASAIIFHSHQEIAQVIYWGDLPEFNRLKTMNFLSYKVFEYYKNTDKKIIDLGPSSEDSLPNYGLGEFKESLGCKVYTKNTFTKKL